MPYPVSSAETLQVLCAWVPGVLEWKPSHSLLGEVTSAAQACQSPGVVPQQQWPTVAGKSRVLEVGRMLKPAKLLIIAVEWKDPGTGQEGSDNIRIAVIGPDAPPPLLTVLRSP